MNNNLLIIGAGQYGAVAKETADAMMCFEQIDFLDDNKNTAIGKISEYKEFVCSYKYAFVSIGNSGLRLDKMQELDLAGYTLICLIHPKSYVSPSAKIGQGCIIEPNAVIQANAELARSVIVSAGAVINHNSYIGDGCHINVGAIVNSNSRLNAMTLLAPGEVHM